jgi:hypothetical protein
LRVSAERVFELARHLTERDRAIALALYEHQLLTRRVRKFGRTVGKRLFAGKTEFAVSHGR